MNKVKVFKSGNSSWVLSLTKSLKKIGVSEGDKLYVNDNNPEKIVLSKKPTSPLKPEIISNNLWNGFEGLLTKMHGRSALEDKEMIKNSLEEAIKDWIQRKDKWWNKKVF